MVEDMETFKFLEQLVVEYLDKNINDVRYESQNSDYEGFICSIDNKISSKYFIRVNRALL